MAQPPTAGPRLLAISDLHVSHADNREIAEALKPETADDWLIVAGDVAETVDDIARTLRMLRGRFAEVVWVPGNHELWTARRDPVRLRGAERYDHLVEVCRDLGVHTPEDPYPVWTGPGGPVTVAPLFTLYDYSFHPPGTSTVEEGLEYARGTGVVCTDEYLLHPDPYPSREAWCAERVAYSERRLAAVDGPTVLVDHYPLVRDPTDVLRYPEFAQWCGTVRTADWHRRFGAVAVVYGHLHIPRTTRHDGVPFHEVSLGYPREWRKWPVPVERPATILPAPAG
ncbi:metallophosphoesterase family protein [Nocardiopsis trehalosi]|jgi:3',5'-cyclic AMP phosphodiesterase CpdA|uniref:metallophosphoesterase family protein n=1 Tax=Nocardiopsis trehalosi TaxID=109329 RepID=UPI00082C7A49|nr:metallophosphoesterase [Nocardiopsis trehalosi]